MRNKINQGENRKNEREGEKKQRRRGIDLITTLSSAPQGQICPFEVGSDLIEFFKSPPRKRDFLLLLTGVSPSYVNCFKHIIEMMNRLTLEEEERDYEQA